MKIFVAPSCRQSNGIATDAVRGIEQKKRGDRTPRVRPVRRQHDLFGGVGCSFDRNYFSYLTKFFVGWKKALFFHYFHVIHTCTFPGEEGKGDRNVEE